MGIVRQIKNVTGGYTYSQKLVREITANNASEPRPDQMREIAELTDSKYETQMIMDVIDKRLNDKGKYYYHIYKSLVLLEFLVKYGSHYVIQWCHQNMYLIKTLHEYYKQDIDGDEYHNSGVIRHRARDLTDLLNNKDRLAEVRRGDDRRRPPRRVRDDDRSSRRQPKSEDDDLQRAIELSKKTAAEEDERRRMAGLNTQHPLQDQQALDLQQQQQEMLRQQQLAQQLEQQNLAQQQALQQLAQQQQYELEQQLAQQQLQQQLAQQEYLRQQQLQQQLALQQQLQQQQQEQQLQQPLKTGSNNPFAAFNAQQAQKQQAQQQTIQQPLETTTTGSRPGLHRKSTFNKEHMDRIDQILSLDAPMDTFGNTGSAMIPAQHTQNTGFVNSRGHGMTQTLTARKTGQGSNPFATTGQQYTGIASTQMQPAHTGYGFGNANHSSTNLIDL